MSLRDAGLDGPTVFVATRSVSRYGLLGAMGEQLAMGMLARGVRVNPAEGAGGGGGRRAYVAFNHPASLESLHAWAGPPGRGRAFVQWCVDHPLTIPTGLLEGLSADPGYRLLTVTDDDAHLLALRFPAVRRATVPHGVDPSALCGPGTIEASHAGRGDDARDIDVLLAGSIASAAELARLRGGVPAPLHGPCEELIRLRLERPAMSFGQALDVAMPAGWTDGGDAWGLMQAVFAYTTAAVGRARRTAVASVLRGLGVVVLGTEAWKEFEGGGLVWGGQVGYAETPSWMRRAKVCVAVNPPQFALGHSERVLLSMGAGCATVAEERLATTRDFGATDGRPACAERFDGAAGRVERVREIVEGLLADGGRRAELGSRGRAEVGERHLWEHRVDAVLAAAGLVGVG
jgi:hypothetical protein